MTKKSLRGFTLFELLIVIAMVAILSTIAYPVFIAVQERGIALKDINNLRQIGVVMQLYINDNDGALPASTTWPGTTATPVLYSKYISAREVFSLLSTTGQVLKPMPHRLATASTLTCIRRLRG